MPGRVAGIGTGAEVEGQVRARLCCWGGDGGSLGETGGAPRVGKGGVPAGPRAGGALVHMGRTGRGGGEQAGPDAGGGLRKGAGPREC